jgi:ATP-dependent Clp protease adapter protein ClpS
MSSPSLLPEIQDPLSGTNRWKVTVFDNDHNTSEEVLAVLILATGCDREEAELEIWEVEAYGKAAVHFAQREECETAASMIGKIGVRTEVCPEWDS